MSEMIAVDDRNFEEQVIKSSLPVLVDFWATWCAPCNKIAPVLDELAREYEGRVRFVKLNVEDSSVTPSRYGVRSIPTLILFKSGREVTRIVGLRTKGELRKQIDAALA